LPQVLIEQDLERGVGERVGARQHLEQHDAERVDVRSRCRRLELDLLGGQVGGRAAHHRPCGLLGRARLERDAEVAQVRVALVVQQDVARLHVAVDDALPVRGVQRGAHLIEDPDRALGLERAVLEHVLEAAAPQVPHDQVRGVRLAPVVVQRHDVRVFEARHELRLALEAADEVGLVRELRVDRLDRHLALDLWLDRSVHGAEGTLADLVEQPVAAQRFAGKLERIVLAQHPLVDVLELSGGIDPELVGQQAPRTLERGESVGLAARSVQREDELAPQALPQRVRARRRLELGDDLCVLAKVEPGADPLLGGDEMELLQPGDLARERRLESEVGQGGSVPELQCLLEGAERSPRVEAVLAHLVQEGLEPERVELFGLGVEPVAGRLTLDAIRTERRAQPRDVCLEGASCGVRRFLAPHRVDQLFGRHDAVHLEQQMRQHEPLLRPTDRHRSGVGGDL
jgi:hypothetical protein